MKYDVSQKYYETGWNDKTEKEKDFYQKLIVKDPEAIVRIGGNQFKVKHYLRKLT